jgi:predicted metal-dependent hydrolase
MTPEKKTPPVRIEVTRNRTSRAYVREETIVIRLAGGLSAAERREHVENLVRRMTKAFERHSANTVIDPLRPLLTGETSLTLKPVIGGPCTIELLAGKRVKTQRTKQGWRLTVAPGVRRKALHRFLWRLVAEHCRSAIEEYMDELNDATLQVSWARLKLGYASSQWGSCGQNGVIMLNPVLLFTSKDILRYVILHEFSHRRFRGHGKGFWAEVARGCPDQEALKKKLKTMRICRL